jgi:hypothetical protein
MNQISSFVSINNMEVKRMEKLKETVPKMKPITFVTTYRGVEGFGLGLYEGLERDVVIAGAEIPWQERGSLSGYDTVPLDVAADAYKGAARATDEIFPRIDEALVYLGKRSATPGFEFAKQLKEAGADVALVACDCDYTVKHELAAGYEMPMIMSECGGKDTLERLVREKLTERV